MTRPRTEGWTYDDGPRSPDLVRLAVEAVDGLDAEISDEAIALLGLIEGDQRSLLQQIGEEQARRESMALAATYNVALRRREAALGELREAERQLQLAVAARDRLTRRGNLCKFMLLLRMEACHAALTARLQRLREREQNALAEIRRIEVDPTDDADYKIDQEHSERFELRRIGQQIAAIEQRLAGDSAALEEVRRRCDAARESLTQREIAVLLKLPGGAAMLAQWGLKRAALGPDDDDSG
jgi:hypothetical protein